MSGLLPEARSAATGQALVTPWSPLPALDQMETIRFFAAKKKKKNGESGSWVILVGDGGGWLGLSQKGSRKNSPCPQFPTVCSNTILKVRRREIGMTCPRALTISLFVPAPEG